MSVLQRSIWRWAPVLGVPCLPPFSPPLVEVRENPEFFSPTSQDHTKWPRCLLWRGWLPGLSSLTFGTPFAVAACDVPCNNLEVTLGSPVPRGVLIAPDLDYMAEAVPTHPNVWSDGSRDAVQHVDVEVAGCRVFTHAPASIFDKRNWGHAQDLDVEHEGRSGIFASDPTPFDNLNVLGGVAKLIDRGLRKSP